MKKIMILLAMVVGMSLQAATVTPPDLTAKVGANTVLAGPTTGANALGSWRALVLGDVADSVLGTGSSITTKFLRGDRTWQTVSTTPADNSITTAMLQNAAVTNEKVADLAIDTGKLADNAVSNAKIQDSSVTTAKIANDAVDEFKIADDAVITAKIADDAVTAAKVDTTTVPTLAAANAFTNNNTFTSDDGTGAIKVVGRGVSNLHKLTQWFASDGTTEKAFVREDGFFAADLIGTADSLTAAIVQDIAYVSLGLQLRNTAMTTWSSDGTWYGTKDAGLARASAGVVEVNNGTAGTLRDLKARGVILSTSTPASASDTGVAGTVTWDANYIYICTATNTWKRVAISTW